MSVPLPMVDVPTSVRILMVPIPVCVTVALNSTMTNTYRGIYQAISLTIEQNADIVWIRALVTFSRELYG